MRLFVSFILLTTPTLWANIITNGGFEFPNLTGNATTRNFAAGSTGIPGWLVTPFFPASVSIVRDTFTDGNLSFLPHSGDQSVNLTGAISGEAAGVLQNVKLQIGHKYELTFWVGNQDNSAPNYMLDTTVALYVDDDLVNFYTNGKSSHHALNWKESSYTFTAATTATSIQFSNATVPNEDYIGLDSVNLEDITRQTMTPEPGTIGLAGAAILLLGACALTKRRFPRRARPPIV
ncbi:MAG: DUF642 domain-containing protein [Bryobacteraceae bacterium]